MNEEYEDNYGLDDYEDSNFYGDDYNYVNYYEPEKQGSKYEVIPQTNVFSQVKDLVEQTSQTVALPFGWSLVLLRQFKWQGDRIGEYFQQMDKYKQMIGYSPYLMSVETAMKQTVNGVCDICLQTNLLVKNICGDSFCRNCWAAHIQQHLNSMNPFMKCMSCQVPLLYETVKQILDNPNFPGYSKQYNKYLKQICQFFTSTSRSYQCCPGADCNYCIKCDNYAITTVKCICGKTFCFKCKNDDHSPCTCQQRAKWIDIVLKEQANAKWIAQNTKLCPWCNKAVERSQGCNFMACLCGKSFCYMCSKPWEPDHKDHFKCHIYKKKGDDEISRQKAVLQKLNFFAQKYLNTNGLVISLKKVDTFEKRRFLYEKLSIDLTQSDFIDHAYKFAIECCQSLKWIYVYSYFVEYLDENRKQRFLFSQGQYESFKEQLLKKLSFDLKNFLLSLQKYLQLHHGAYVGNDKQKFTQQFLTLKTNIINYYKFTKQFKQKFVEEIESVEYNLIKRNLQHSAAEIEESKKKIIKK